MSTSSLSWYDMCVQEGNHHTISHNTIVDHGEQTWVVAVKNVALFTTLSRHQLCENVNHCNPMIGIPAALLPLEHASSISNEYQTQ